MMPSYVVDASYVIAFLMPDESVEGVDEVFIGYADRECSLIAATLLPYEVLNGFKSALIRSRISERYGVERIRDFAKLNIPLYEIDFEDAFLTASKNDLSIYDAAYVALSRATGFPLLSLDERLRGISE
ncbi:MAG: type II toxin-antitoxin system VapC family toxin [Patescibacteria group bacterium]